MTRQRHSKAAANEESGHSRPHASPACPGGHRLD